MPSATPDSTSGSAPHTGTARAPDGFTRRARRSPLTDPWEPIFERADDTGVTIGLWLREAHCNARGFAHGGLISTLADTGMGHSCVSAMAKPQGLVTITLTTDFIGVARTGSWLEIAGTVTKTGRSLCFASCVATADGVLCARASATFKIISAPL